MYVFVLLAACLLVPVYLHRRRLSGFVILIGGIAILHFATLGIEWLLTPPIDARTLPPGAKLGAPGGMFEPMSQIYEMLVVSVGLTLALLPRVHPPGTCRRCGYDLDGLHHDLCPECGTPFDPDVVESELNGEAHERLLTTT